MIKDILKLGDARLYQKCCEVTYSDFDNINSWISDLHDTLLDYRKTYGAGRAIAAPQIGIFKRMIYMLTDREYIFINPILEFIDDDQYEVMDDCMSFPGLCVKVSRHKRALIKYYDRFNQYNEMMLDGDYSELLQHEYDHLDGILSTMRAINNKSFFMMNMTRNF